MSIAKRDEKFNSVFFQSLSGHTIDCLKILKCYIIKNKGVIDDFCEFWGINSELLLKNLFIFIYFHDIGKLIEEFQHNIKKGKSSSNYPHALYSFNLILNINYDLILPIELEKLSVLAHHTQLHSSIYDDVKNKPTFCNKKIYEFLDQFMDVYYDLSFDNYFNLTPLDFNPNFNFKSLKFIKYKNKLVRHSAKYDEKIKLKSIFCFFFSILQLCDDYSSYDFSQYIKKEIGNSNQIFGSVLENPSDYVVTLEKDYISQVFRDYELYDFQKDLLNSNSKYSLLFAPCGRGKTEAALGWALASLKKFNKNKIIFAMPTQVTSNAMWERLINIFGEGNVGLYHGKSFIKLNDAFDYKNSSDIQSEVFKGNIFFKPITITTIDHLIYSFVHGFNQADFALGNIQNSVIIFDEVHYYDQKTLNHLFTLYGLLKKMNIPHLLMSGTLPNFFLDAFNSYQKFVDDEGLNFCPFSINFRNELLIDTKKNNFISRELEKEIKDNYDNSLKQFFIFNTIERAKQFFIALKKINKDFNIVLYHSQFTHFDRVKKENEIIKKCSSKDSFILIATQIIEISLDISADVMYTEIAPPDALGQRGGRLNRKKESGFYEMNIFDSESHVPYDEELINRTKDSIRLGKVSYVSFKEWCDAVYSDKKFEKSNLIKFFNDSVLFGNQPKDVAFSEEQGNKLEIRDSSFQKVDVIPIEIYNNDKNNLIVENQVKIPLWWIKNDEEENIGNAKIFFNETIGKKQFIVSKMKYSYELGFIKDCIVTLDDFNEFVA